MPVGPTARSARRPRPLPDPAAQRRRPRIASRSRSSRPMGRASRTGHRPGTGGARYPYRSCNAIPTRPPICANALGARRQRSGTGQGRAAQPGRRWRRGFWTTAAPSPNSRRSAWRRAASAAARPSPRSSEAPVAGTVVAVDNRRLARIAKLSGAPQGPAAGIDLHVAIGTRVERGQKLLTLRQIPGALGYAAEFVEQGGTALSIEPGAAGRSPPCDPAGLAAALADGLGGRIGEVEMRRFPDGETYLRLGGDLNRGRRGDRLRPRCARCEDRSALFAATTARDLGARRVLLAAPYLPYLRQDCRFHDGEKRQRPRHGAPAFVVSRWRRDRRSASSSGYPPSATSSSFPQLPPAPPANRGLDRPQCPRRLPVGPDGESAQWVSRIAALAGRPFAVLDKDAARRPRRGDPSARGRRCAVGTPVFVDDIVSRRTDADRRRR